MIVVLALERTVELPMVMLVCIAAVVFPFIWCVGKRAFPVYRHGVIAHLTVTVCCCLEAGVYQSYIAGFRR